MGNFSKDPQAVLQDNLSRGYVGVHIEQGVPVLDRDLNLMNDLNAALFRTALGRYIGNGVAAGNTGFQIEGVGLDNDFQIDAGQMLVNGLEVTNPATIKYSGQPGVPPLTPAGPGRQDLVYLDLSLTEIDGSKDNNLLNGGDVGAQTSVRQQAVAIVRVVEGSAITPPPLPVPGVGHSFIMLARLNRPPGTKINAGNVVDLRQPGLTLAALEARVRTLEQFHAAVFASPTNQILTKLATAGSPVTIAGRNFDIGPLTVSFQNIATQVRASAIVVGPTTATQTIVTAPAGVKGNCVITITNPYGTDISVDQFNALS